jgi:hypothetical protein
MGILSSAIKSVPVVGQVYHFSEVAMNVTKVTDPVEASVKGVELVLKDCVPPPFKLSIECVLLVAEIGGAVEVSGSNPEWPNGGIAQLVEHRLCTAVVSGSNPLTSTKDR